LIEIMLGTSIMVIVLVAMLGSFLGQSTLNQNSRNMMAAMNDATRVMEEIRRQNATSVTGSLCAQSNIPSARPPTRQSWNEWFERDAQPGKSVGAASQPQSERDRLEVVVVTCQEVGDQDGDGTADEYCGKSNQTGQQEWQPWWPPGQPTGGGQSGNTLFDPIRVTVAVGWSLRPPRGTSAIGGINSGREFTYRQQGNDRRLYVGPDADGDRVIESPAMVTTLVTCR